MSEEDAFRSFVDVPVSREKSLESRGASNDGPLVNKLAAVRDGVVGNWHKFNGPFGEHNLVYADWTASGRAYAPIEGYVNENVYPFYANTHTSTSISGLQSTCYRLEARQIIQQAVNGNTAKDVVLFTGSGATAAINKLVHVLGLKIPLGTNVAPESRPVVFVGPFEHHSNLLPWRESNADVVYVQEDKEGCGIDVDHLEKLLVEYKCRPLRIGSFSAASNVTGVVENVDAISALLHRHGALACWDYACAGPYADIDMNPVLDGTNPDRPFVHKDAIFISPHKFLGGVNSPGILVAKKRLFENKVPAAESVGGGTVYFVKKDSHRYLSNRVEREEGGTPDVVGAIRAGLAFQLKQSIGVATIEMVERKWAEKIAAKLGNHPNIALLGPNNAARDGKHFLPIASFLIRHGSHGLFLHYNFVSAMLNDLYGIQTRGGCMCAGPYAQRLLGMDSKVVDGIEAELVRDPKHSEYMRPGFSRLSLAYFISELEADFILDAVVEVATHGWRLLPQYRFNTRTGEWKHKTRFTKFPDRLWLEDAPLFNGISTSSSLSQGKEPAYSELLVRAKKIMCDPSLVKGEKLGDQGNLFSSEAAPLRWFLLPSEAQAELCGKAVPPPPQLEQNTQDVDERSGIALGPAIIDPQEYWKNLQTVDIQTLAGSAPTSSITKKSKLDNNKDNEPLSKKPKVICEDNSCFRVRKKDKFPVRSSELIRQEESSTQGVTVVASTDKLIGEMDMHNAKLRPKPPKNLIKQMGKAIADWDMIKEGDRLLLGLSGGKDSLTLLHLLLHFQKRAPIKFEVSACTIDPLIESFDPSSLIPYMKSLGVEYHFVQTPIFEQAKTSMQGSSICAFCARMKRGALYSCAREHGYNVLVLAQHLDDLVETTFMSLFEGGILRSMQANYTEQGSNLRIIRPLCYTREHDLKEFAYKEKLPVINENCPACFEAPQERKRMKKLLAKEETRSPQLFGSFRRGILPLMDPEVLDYLKEKTTYRDRVGTQKYRDRQKGNKRGQPAKNATPNGETVSGTSEKARPSDGTCSKCGEHGKCVCPNDNVTMNDVVKTD
uniref:Uncharacterized protein n=1 Tax=Mucochytrium quahogii TaxID=96639 RepID=A0A7S2RBR9_9STRA|mmetsp:Transcript_26973/g.43415  ORF Transcript_26973/g.43415 Transcript_26973/m.43415 type:complete len:1059 (-) Transcript_26973:2529-5705(-)|eukprot:CAMPEP_0203762998 /NCGR_PEP_ID=MMETSP0098-20131031/15738_1 /ASSEMBLY_ACC=CAM_ASM_000208 /TAXON_ID=96639 /ORGANISM=" , Strain NY0313808BC1" /LENGTH=1058 /DNA_ID=CAMNT_0050657601 /DNA_START=346 /DNA_END=3522 /DNA_ORIENTATION=+